jgi:hypothetical protein
VDAAVGDTRFRFAKAVERAQHNGWASMLDRIELYGTLELSWHEMPQLLEELHQLLLVSIDDQERTVLHCRRGGSSGAFVSVVPAGERQLRRGL